MPPPRVGSTWKEGILRLLGMMLKAALCALVAWPWATRAAGQQALVLSTGASRGVAHAGVLVGLDSLGYDPDLVVGSSMGAVMGALYASGYEPAEIWALVETTDWGDIFRPRALLLGPRRQLYNPAIRLGVNLGPFEVSRGFIPDWRVNRLLVRLLFEADAASRGDFDRLPRRYRTVVADLATGEEIVIERGDLARAVRISMGTPGFFAPVERDGRLLVDGGVANYLPISVARRLGGSPIVAVDVSRPHPRPQRLDPAAVGGRAIGLLMRNAVPDTAADVLVRPDIDPDFSGAFFLNDQTWLLQLGLQAALEAQPPEGKAQGARALPPPPERWSQLRLEVPDAGLEPMVRSVFEDVAPGPYDPALVMERVDRLYATGLVDGVWPRVEGAPALVAGTSPGAAADGAQEEDVLVVRVDVVPKTSLGLAAGYDNDRGGRVWLDLQQRVPLSVFPTELTLAAAPSGLQRWGETSVRVHSLRRPLSWVAGAHARETSARLVGQGDDGAPEVLRFGGWLGPELYQVFPDWSAVLAFQGEWVDFEEAADGWSAGPLLRVSSVPPPAAVVGIPSELEVDLRFGEVAYASAALRASRSVPLSRFQAAAVFDLALTAGGAPPDVEPALGDRHAMPGLAWGAGRGDGRVVMGVDLAAPFLLGGVWRLRARTGVAASTWRAATDSDAWLLGAALEGLWTLPFAPILVGVGGNTQGDVRLDVSLGKPF